MTKRRPGGPHPGNRRNAADRCADAAIVFDLRLQGLTYSQIDALTSAPDGPTNGRRVSRSQAGDLLREEIARRIDPKVDEWRAIQLDRLEGVVRDHLAMRNAHWDRAMKCEVPAALAVDRALNGVTKTIGEQNKLLGIATTKIEAHVTEVTQADIELAELIREAKAKNAIEEARIKDGNGSA